jgi:mannose-6-phosphate isomerase
VELDDNKSILQENDIIFISKGSKHRVKNLQLPSTILEISMGEFDESDIVRLEDAYNRK